MVSARLEAGVWANLGKGSSKSSGKDFRDQSILM